MKSCLDGAGCRLTFPPDYSRVVRGGKDHAVGYLLATSGACLTLRDEELRHIDRNLVDVAPGQLPTLRPTGSWLLAVLLCPGDRTDEVAAWAKGLPGRAAERVVFYLAPGVDEADALRGWAKAGFLQAATSTVKDWPQFHKRFGRDFNDQVYRDARDHPGWSAGGA